MSIFSSIGNAFKDGWNKNSRDKEKNNISIPNSDEYINNITVSSFLNPNNPNDLNNSSNTTNPGSSNKYNYKSSFENNFKLSSYILSSVSKNYKFIYSQTAQLLLDFGFETENGKTNTDKISYVLLNMGVVPSMFNPLYGINIVGVTGNTPLIDNNKTVETNISYDSSGKEFQTSIMSPEKDIHDCSIKTLVKLSSEKKLGHEIYKFADFMYCKQLGKFSNNRLITLRRFPVPIGDDIRTISPNSSDKGHDVHTPGDIGRLVCWMDDDNKLENILKYEYKETWREEKGEYQDVDSKTGQETDTWLGSFVNLANPAYRKEVASGWQSGSNKILDAFNARVDPKGIILKGNGGNWDNNREVLTRYDKHRVYEPTATIKTTHLYEGTLEFSHNFTLVFDYELRAYEHINPKTAFLDLLNNIQQVTYRTGKFWGGDVWWIGSPYNKRGWETATAFMDNSWNKLNDTFSMLLHGTMNIGDLLGNFANTLTKAGTKILNTASSIMSNPDKRDEFITNIENWAGEHQIKGMIYGMIQNKLGRPSLYAANTILNGDPVGLWHVTIGNPRNPILSIGNLIIESSSIQHYGPLGFDDFPTGLRLTVNLKHGRPRDMVEIGKMYTGGRAGLAIPMADGEFSKYMSNDKYSDDEFPTMWSSTKPAISNGFDLDTSNLKIPENNN